MTKLVNRAKMTTATTGTGTITLGTAESGYQSFADAGVVDTDVVRYVIEDGTDWEIGTGTYTATGTTLSRTVSESSNAGSAITLTGSAVVYVSATAEDIPAPQELYAENPVTFTAPSATGTNAVAIGSGAVSSGTNSIAVGTGSSAGTFSVGIGWNAGNTGSNNTIIGRTGAITGTSGATVIGYNADASDYSSNQTAIGYNAKTVSGAQATALTNSYASGTDSFAAAIANNTSSYGATGANSVAIGQLAKATGSNGVAIGAFSQATIRAAVLGETARATGTGALALGKNSLASGGNSIAMGLARASGNQSVAIGGGFVTSSATASANESFALGDNAKATELGKYAYSSNGGFSASDRSQYGLLVLRSDTTDATPEALTSSNSAASTTNQIILPNNSAYAFHGTIVARQDAASGTACAAWKIEGLIRREGSAGTTVLVNSATTVLDNTPAWGMALSADTTNGGLKIEVTGAAATNIRWVATIHTSEVTY